MCFGRTLGLQEGRSSDRWVDFSLYGHQIVCHQVDGYSAMGAQNAVDGDPVPVPHFGLAMTQEQFHEVRTTLKKAIINPQCGLVARRDAIIAQWC